MGMTLLEQLLVVARAFCKARGMSLSRASTLVFNDGKKLDAIAYRGSDLATARYEAAMRWFSESWPDGVDWPAGARRPELSGRARR